MATAKIEVSNELPPNEKEFTIDVEKGDTTGERHKGRFTTVCVQNLKQKSEADLQRAALNGPHGGSLAEETRLYHLVVSELQHRLTFAPKWFREADFGRDLKDMNVLIAIFNECMKAEKEWREAVWGPVKAVSTIEESEEDEQKDDTQE